MNDQKVAISPLFLNEFEVDESVPFKRHLNRLEVEIGEEDYSQLKNVELLDHMPPEEEFASMEDITGRLLETTQNNYNRELLLRLKARIYLKAEDYSIYYRLPGLCLRFIAKWRQNTLKKFFRREPIEDTGWHPCGHALPGFEGRYLPDEAGGVLLLRHGEEDVRVTGPLVTASHGPYDPHTLEVTLYFLRSGKGGSALINLGFSGREPLADENLEKLEQWGVPLNPSNIDVIYPYTDAAGHPYCYKLEENLALFAEKLETGRPELILDIHGCVGTYREDQRVVVGLGGLPPFREPEELGSLVKKDGILFLQPNDIIRHGLSLVRELSAEMYVQFCADSHLCYNFALLGGMQLLGFQVDPEADIDSLLDGEERAYLPADDLRWIPGAGANALQRISARRLNPKSQCIHVEIPTAIRKKMILKLRSLEIESSLDASGL